MIERFAALDRSSHEDRQLVLEAALADEIIQRLRAEGRYLLLLSAAHRLYQFIGDAVIFVHFPTLSALQYAQRGHQQALLAPLYVVVGLRLRRRYGARAFAV